MAAAHPHPYVPEDLSLPDYHPPHFGRPAILVTFFPLVALVTAWCVHRVRNSKSHAIQTAGDGVVFSWFVVSGLIHFFIEGSFVIYAEVSCLVEQGESQG